MFCIKCGAELPDDAIFCMGCGTNIEDSTNEKEKNVNIGKRNYFMIKYSVIIVLAIVVMLIVAKTVGEYAAKIKQNSYDNKMGNAYYLLKNGISNNKNNETTEDYDKSSVDAQIAISGAKAVYANVYGYADGLEARIVEKDNYNRFIVHIKKIDANGIGGYNITEYYILVRVEGDSYYYDLNNAFAQANDIGLSALKNLNNWGKKP